MGLNWLYPGVKCLAVDYDRFKNQVFLAFLNSHFTDSKLIAVSPDPQIIFPCLINNYAMPDTLPPHHMKIVISPDQSP